MTFSAKRFPSGKKEKGVVWHLAGNGTFLLPHVEQIDENEQFWIGGSRTGLFTLLDRFSEKNKNKKNEEKSAEWCLAGNGTFSKISLPHVEQTDENEQF